MNIFVLSTSPKLCARYHCDKHVVKMIVESAQLLCTAQHVNGTRKRWMYKPTHRNHPCAVWVRTSTNNYLWLLELAEQLCVEYTRRYGRTHKTQRIISRLRDLVKSKRVAKPKSFVYCSAVKSESATVVGSYRHLYTVKAKTMHVLWNHSTQPAWYVPPKRLHKGRARKKAKRVK